MYVAARSEAWILSGNLQFTLVNIWPGGIFNNSTCPENIAVNAAVHSKPLQEATSLMVAVKDLYLNKLGQFLWTLKTWKHKYTVSQKKLDTKLLPITLTNTNQFSNFFFTDRLISKFATKSRLNILPCHKHVATLPCEIWMSKMAPVWNMYCN